jgi:hypothetical protein
MKTKPNLSMVALLSFIEAFTVARIFTIVYPEVVWRIGGFHIHHFWYGLVLLAVGGWLGISVESERASRVAAILFGTGGGLIVDEAGVLLTLSAPGYWEEFTYTFVIVLLTVVSMLILLVRYSKVISTEFTQFLRSNASLYIGIFLAAVSAAFILTNNLIITTASSVTTLIAIVLILAYFIHRLRAKR